MCETDELRQETEQLRNDMAAQSQRLAELEAWVVCRLDQQADRQERRTQRVKHLVELLRDHAALAIGLVGLAIALWGASPEARAKATDSWISSVTAASLGAIAIAVQRAKATDQDGSGKL